MKALILAGGVGKRLKPITDSTPKPLINIAGKPIAVHQIQWLRKHGITEFIFAIGYLKERFIETLGDGSKHGVHITYSIEEEPLGTGGALKNATDLLKDEETFYVVNGDIITDINPNRLLEAVDEKTTCVIALVPLPSPYGVVYTASDDRVVLFQEKPIIRDYWINAGLYLFKPEIFKHLPDRGDLETTLFQKLADERTLKAIRYYHYTIWKSIDTHKDIEEAEKLVEKYKIYIA